MPLAVHSVTFDAADALALAGFWAAALDLPLSPKSTPEFAAVGGGAPLYLFFPVPEGKTAKNRVHLDLEADDRAAEVERLIRLGASLVADHDRGGRWTVMQDPEGNEFCVVQKQQ